MGARPQLPNSPLVEVAFEVKFRGQFAVYAGMSSIQRRLESTHPRLQVPQVNPGEFLDLKPYRFANPDDTEFVQVGLNSLGVITRRYTVFDSFKAKVVEALDVLSSVHVPSAFTRVGLRYVNLLPVAEASTPRGLHPWLSLEIPCPSGTRWVSGSQVALVREMDGFLMKLGAGAIQQSVTAPFTPQPQVFLLDIDCFLDGHIEAADLDGLLQRAHEAVDATFFGLLTEDGKINMGATP